MERVLKPTIYLNDADGRKSARLESIEVKSPDRQLVQLRGLMNRYWGVDQHDIEFAQNTTTHIAYLIEIIKKKYPNAVVFLDSHELAWIRKAIELGKLPLRKMTHGNYTGRSHQYTFPKSKVVVFEPSNLIASRKRYLQHPAIVVWSHISRQTGEELITEQETEINYKTFFIIDGAQALGPIPTFMKDKFQAYLTVTSKFIGAEPHLGIAYISKEFKKQFSFEYPRFEPSQYSREIYSAVSALSNVIKHDYEINILSLRKFALKELSKIHRVTVVSPASQVPHFITISVGGERKTQTVVKQLREEFGIIVYHNISYNIHKPTIPLIRISISPRTNKEHIRTLVQGLKKILAKSF